MIYAAILAAGFGIRMHRQDLPKPFLALGSKPIIIHTLEQFFLNQRIDKIIVVTADTWRTYTEDLIRRHNTFGKDVDVIAGGKSKTESVSLVVQYITGNFQMGDTDILVSHDAVRPFVTQRMIDENIDAALAHNAVSTVMTTNDTTVVSIDGIRLHEVPTKFTMLAAQTPQSFNLRILDAMFGRAAEAGVELKDETELVRLYMRYGGDVRLVKGEYSNMKIINPYDLEIANALLEERSK